MNRRAFINGSLLFVTRLSAKPWILSSMENLDRPMIWEKPVCQNDAIDVIRLTGTPRQRGRIHGEALKAKIADAIKCWKRDLLKLRQQDPDAYINEFLENTNFTAAINKWAPEVLEEVKGISEGSGIDYKTIFAYQLWDEEWWYAARNRINGIDTSHGVECSAIGVFGQKDMPTLVAQNMDLMGWTNGFQVLLDIKHQHSSLESFVFTIAGLIATCGMNNRAIGICCNTVLRLNQRTNGLPVQYVVRGVLERSRYEDAIDYVTKIKHASGQNYVIGGPNEAVSLEASANKVSRFIPYRGANRVYHTNHALVNDDQSVYEEILKKFPQLANRSLPSNSEIRFAALEKRLKDPSLRITVETIQSILSSHDDPLNPVCKDKAVGGDSFTAGCLIMELSHSPLLRLAAGPPCSTKFKEYRFNDGA